MTTNVSFKIAKLLKDKGFDNVECNSYYNIYEDYIKTPQLIHSNKTQNLPNCLLSPTTAKVIMWIYEKHQIWISVKIIKWNYEKNTNRFNYNICKLIPNNPSDIKDVSYDFESPAEAYLAAIEYILTNLI